MKIKLFAFTILMFFVLNLNAKSDKDKIQFVGIENVKVDDPFWSPKFKLWRETTATDILNKFEGKHTHNLDNNNVFTNFDRVAKGEKGTNNHIALPWFDGLIFETIRGISDYLVQYPDKVMEQRIDGYIERIEAAQKADPNGYLQTYVDLNVPNFRWGENGGFLRWQHDVYNAGMLIEAGIHYYKATGKTKLLTVATRLANYMTEYMGPFPKKNVVPSHSGPEESMIKLYWLYKNNQNLKKNIEVPVNEQAFWNLATFWIENRGQHCGYPLWLTWGNQKSEEWIRANTYSDPKYGNHSRPSWGDYAQDSIPVFEQQTIEGHAVRATLLATGIATAALENHSAKYIQTAERLWNNMIGKRMFITGGVGAIHHDEKFGDDYFLPNDAYLETCAAIGAGFFSQRMNELTGKAMYMDELERIIYNSLLTAVSASGVNYTYQNPLNSDHHNRWEWHSCPCCPPMFLKITSEIPGYIYSHSNDEIFVNLFIGSSTIINLPKNNIEISQQTRYPWEGAVEISLKPEKKKKFALKVRIPGWARGEENPYGLYNSNLKERPVLSVNGKKVEIQLEGGYAVIKRKWSKNDIVKLELPMEPRIIAPNMNIKNLTNQTALASGPVIYSFEDVDNPDFSKITLNSNLTFTKSFDNQLFNGVNVIKCKGSINATAIPYFAIANRKKDSKHKVWVVKE